MATPPRVVPTASPNRTHLIAEIESLKRLDGRYEKCRCINYAPGKFKRGNFSLVFKAIDVVENKEVAIKFFDPEQFGEAYRIDCFRREPKILARVKSSPRCVQVNGPMQKYTLSISIAGGGTFRVPCEYFVCDWIDEDIDDFFDRQDQVEAIAKLEIFRGIVAAVNSIHQKQISHRDIQAKNFRHDTNCQPSKVVLIDFGTAAAHDTVALLTHYNTAVGMLDYAAPESFLGMAGDRSIGMLSDIYSLGALLFELFNKHRFCYARDTTTEFQKALAALGLILANQSTTDAKKRAWESNVRIFRTLAMAPPLDGSGSSVPAVIAQELIEIYRKMTEFDYANRLKNLERVIARMDTAIKVLSHEKLYQKRLKQQRIRRANRVEKLKRRQERIEEYQRKRPQSC